MDKIMWKNTARLWKINPKVQVKKKQTVEAKRETGGTARGQIAASLVDVECAFLQEDIRGRGQPRSFRQDFGEREVEIRIGVRELRRHGMGTEPGRDPAGFPDRA